MTILFPLLKVFINDMRSSPALFLLLTNLTTGLPKPQQPASTTELSYSSSPLLPPVLESGTLSNVPGGCFTDNGKWTPVTKDTCLRTLAIIAAMGPAARTWQPKILLPYKWNDTPVTCSIAVRATSKEAATFSARDILASAEMVFERCDREGGFGGTTQLIISGVPEAGWSVEVIGKFIGPLMTADEGKVCALNSF